MQRGMVKPPLFPIIPFLFPLAFVLATLGLTAWFSYLSWRELIAIRQAEQED